MTRQIDSEFRTPIKQNKTRPLSKSRKKAEPKSPVSKKLSTKKKNLNFHSKWASFPAAKAAPGARPCTTAGAALGLEDTQASMPAKVDPP